MSIAIRLDDRLIQEAETEALLHKRSTPKQIEYWAQIGRLVTDRVSANDLLGLVQGVAEVRVEFRPAQPVDADAVFASVEQARADGSLRREVSGAVVRYEASPGGRGLLDRVWADGRRESGHFRNGEFVPVA
jgi:hypothetical protein